MYRHVLSSLYLHGVGLPIKYACVVSKSFLVILLVGGVRPEILSAFRTAFRGFGFRFPLVGAVFISADFHIVIYGTIFYLLHQL